MLIYIIAALDALVTIATKGNQVIISLYALHLGANPIALGVLLGVNSFFPMFLALHSGKIIDKFGNRLPLVLGAAGNTLALILPFLYQKLIVLYITQTIFGISNLFFHLAMQNLVGSMGGKKARTRNFMMLSLGSSIAGSIGPLLAGISVDMAGFTLTYLFISILVFIPGFVFLLVPSLVPHKEQSDENKSATSGKSSFDLFKMPHMRRVFISSGIVLTGTSLFTFYMPIYGNSIGLSATVIGIIVGIYSSAFFVVRLFMTSLVNKFGGETILAYSLFVAAFAFLLFPLVDQVYLLGAISFLLGLGLGCGQPISIILTYNRSPEGRTAEALGIRLMVNRLTTFSVPLLFGTVGSVFGLFPVFWTNTLMLAFGGWISSNRGKKQVGRSP